MNAFDFAGEKLDVNPPAFHACHLAGVNKSDQFSVFRVVAQRFEVAIGLSVFQIAKT
jgi:hypothetical protein